MPKKTILLFLSLLLILSSCKRDIPIDSQKTDTDPNSNIPQKTVPSTQESIATTQESITTTPKSIDIPQTSDPEEITEPTKNPEQMLNDILKELDELEQLMDGNT